MYAAARYFAPRYFAPRYFAGGDTTAPGVPTGLAALAGDTLAYLTWDAVADPGDGLHYRIYQDGTPVQGGLSEPFRTVAGLTNGVAYSFAVTSFDDHDNESAASDAVTVVPGAPGSGTVGEVDDVTAQQIIDAVIAGILVTPANKIGTDGSNRVTTANPATQIVVQQGAPIDVVQS